MVSKGRKTWNGIVEIDGKLACEKCKTIEPECKPVTHIDGVDYYRWIYNCEKCGNVIAVDTIRTDGIIDIYL